MFETVEEYIKEFEKLPKYHLTEKWEKIFNEMAVHTRKRVPEELLLKRRPNEDEEIFKYRLANYEPITYGSMNKCLDDVNRILSAVNYQVKAEQVTQEYLLKESFNSDGEKLSFDEYIQKVVLKRMIEDPNGFLVWLPAGAGVRDSSVKVQPKPYLVYSFDTHYIDENIFSFLAEEKTPLRVAGNKVEYCGLVYYILDNNTFYKFYQEGPKSKPTWVFEPIYNHKLGRIPAIKLGGDINAQGYYESYFSPYNAFGNEAIRQYSDWQAIMTLSNHPLKEVFQAECEVDVVQKLANNIPETDENFKKIVKQGKLKLKNKTASPYAVIERKVLAKSQENFEANLPYEFPSVRFIQPSIENAKYAGESWQLLIDKAEQALNIDMTVGVNQSGVAKQIDKESQYSMLSKIGNNIFGNVVYKSLLFIEGYLTIKDVTKVVISIIKPSTFWVKNELDLVNEITTLKEKNAPAFFMAEASVELAKKRFAGNPVSKKMFDFIATYDPLFVYSTSEKQLYVASGLAEARVASISLYMSTILMQIAQEISYQSFIDIELEKLKELFDAKINVILPPPTPMFENNGTNEEDELKEDDLGSGSSNDSNDE